MNEVVIDAGRTVLGRLASYAAKQALLGDKVIVVNCNHALLSGDRRMIISEYAVFKKKGGDIQKGPFLHRAPQRIVKRTIRGMLPHMQKRGIDALKRVMCYNEVPEKYSSSKKINVGKPGMAKTMSLAELSREV